MLGRHWELTSGPLVSHDHPLTQPVLLLPGQSAIPIEAVPAGSMDAGVAVALIDFRQACGVVVALRAAAGEARDAILTGAPIVAGAACTLINVDIAHAPCGQEGAQIPSLLPRAHPS